MEYPIEKVISFIISPSFSGWTMTLKIGLTTASLIFLILIILLLAKNSWLRFFLFEDLVEFLTYRPYGLKRIEKIWNKIKARPETGSESEHKLAVIEADNILDDILGKIGYKGKTIDEKLDQLSPSIISNIEQIKKNHQIRNSIVHDPDFKLSLDEAKKILSDYEQTLIDLQVL